MNPAGYDRGRRRRAGICCINDLDAFQQVQASVLAQAGCRACTSGLNLIWETYTHFTVDPGGEVRPVIGGEIAAPGA